MQPKNKRKVITKREKNSVMNADACFIKKSNLISLSKLKQTKQTTEKIYIQNLQYITVANALKIFQYRMYLYSKWKPCLPSRTVYNSRSRQQRATCSMNTQTFPTLFYPLFFLPKSSQSIHREKHTKDVLLCASVESRWLLYEYVCLSSL